MLAYSRMIEALNDFVQKACDNETLGYGHWNAARPKIEKFVFVNLARRCPVGATHVVGENFQTRHGVSLCLVTQQEVAHLLVRIREMSMGFYPNKSAENSAGTIVESVFVQEIACRVWREMVLQCAGVEFLFMISHRDGQQIAAGPFAHEAA